MSEGKVERNVLVVVAGVLTADKAVRECRNLLVESNLDVAIFALGSLLGSKAAIVGVGSVAAMIE